MHMRIIRYSDGTVRYGLLDDDGTIQPLAGPPFGGLAAFGRTVRRDDVQLLAPLEPRAIYGVGLNYVNHAREMNVALPEVPMLFMKPTGSAIGPGSPIVLPREGGIFHFEAEVAVVIGRIARRVPEDAAPGYILGYTCGNDVSERVIQGREMKQGCLLIGKAFDSFNPLGPSIVTDLDPGNITILGRVNGELKQSSNTSDLVYSVAQLVSYLSQAFTLYPGDVIMTGTPAGVGPVHPGDVVEIEIPEVGILRNRRRFRRDMTAPVTLKDIALKLDLAVSTIGRALTDDPQISEATKARVRAAAAELGYVAHSAARSMRSGKSTLVGLIIPDIENEFYGKLAKALAEVFSAAGYQLVLAITEDDPESEERQVRVLLEARVSGLVITATPQTTRETVMLLSRSRCVQIIRRISQLSAPWFGIDEEAALFEATNHLISLGHRRIGYLGVSTSLSTGRSRLAGYERAFERSGLAPPRHLVHLGQPRAAFGAAAFGALWSGAERPSAVVAAGARLTVGMLQAVAERKLRIPDDVSVVGYGEAPWWNQELTTISLPVREMALACGDFLLRRIREAGGPSPAAASASGQSITFASSLIQGASTRSVASPSPAETASAPASAPRTENP